MQVRRLLLMTLLSNKELKEVWGSGTTTPTTSGFLQGKGLLVEYFPGLLIPLQFAMLPTILTKQVKN
jgi:hypothetical protein